MIIITYLIVMILSTIEGIVHQILYSRKGAGWSPGNEHSIYNINRITWGLLFIGGVLLGRLTSDTTTGIMIAKIILWGIGSWLSFSFFHNGGYGVARHCEIEIKWLGKIRWTDGGIFNGWKYVSPTDSAKFKVNFENRFWLFVFGLACILIAQFIIKDR